LYFFKSYIKVKKEFITKGEIKMNKKDLVENIIMNNPTLTKKSVDEIVNSVFENMVEALSNGETVDIFGFGKFEVTERKERDGINPATKERIRIKASKNVKFKPTKSLKDKVN
jgi:DNA-binding protein HU-beta